MSTSFEVFPTLNTRVKCLDLINESLDKFQNFLERNRIKKYIKVTVQEEGIKGNLITNPIYISNDENRYTILNINDIGEIYIFYHSLTELDTEFWKEEIIRNHNAKKVENKIISNKELGYFWSIKRTMAQPAIVSLFYGYIAMTIAKLSAGIVYSDDGAWDYSSLPMEYCDFESLYLDLDKVNDSLIKKNIQKWICLLKYGK